MPTDPFRARWIECEAVSLKTKEFLSHFSWCLNINLNIKVMKSEIKEIRTISGEVVDFMGV